jgi:UDP-N-acetylmuramoylalanine--D-glutamate ligase
MDVQGKRVLIVGWARSGRAAADLFRRQGAIVTVSDVRPPWTFASEIPALLSERMGLEFGAHREETFLCQDLVVTSPGVPWNLPALESARTRGIPIVPEVEAASWFLEGILVGVTGSNGKTTTTTLLGKMLEASGFSTFVGGNIGVPLISAVGETSRDSMVVTELSSFQLEAIQTLRPHVAVLLNVTPNHLDRHPSFDAYLEAKARIFRNQTLADYAVLNADDATVMSLAPGLTSRQILFSLRQDLLAGVLVSGSDVLYRTNHLERVLFSTRDLKLRGDFNLEDALAASAAACVLGADFGSIARAVREFRGVEHRLEFVRQVRGVDFYNDSKATSVDATTKALTAFDHGVHLILGGKDKGAPYAPIRVLLRGRVREVLLIGAAAERIAEELDGAVDLVQAGDLETAVRAAFARAVSGDTVLLAPACSSYDQFQDFEERGRTFKDLVARLAQEFAFGTPAVRPEAARSTPAKAAEPAPPTPPSVEPPEVADSEKPAAAERTRPALSGSAADADPAEAAPAALLKPAAPIATASSAQAEGPPAAVEEASAPLAARDEKLTAVPATPAAEPVTASAVEESQPAPANRPELVYVYEVDAEVNLPMDVDFAPDEPEVANGDLVAFQHEEASAGDALLFEVSPHPPLPTPADEGKPAGDAPAPAAGGRRKERKRKPKVPKSSGGAEPEGSGRLPGF